MTGDLINGFFSVLEYNLLQLNERNNHKDLLLDKEKIREYSFIYKGYPVNIQLVFEEVL